jgi:penicillin-binding protein 1A
VGFIAFLSVVFMIMYAFARIPEPNDISTAQSVIVVDPHGKLIGRIHADADRLSIPLSQMPMDLRHAVIATEDRTFYSNPGISLTGIVRAAFADVFGGGHQGGSTITQQYVKNAFVGSQHSLLRKAKEAVIALKLDHQRTKDQILELYLNTIYFGRGAYGVEAAAEAYFGTHARSLTLSESAMLAGLIRSPEGYDPGKDPEAAANRRNVVLGLMVSHGYITQDAADKAKAAKVTVRVRVAAGIAPHYLEDVQRFLETQIGPSRLYRGGIRVYGTLDATMQEAANDAVHTVYNLKTDPNAALVSIDPHTGAVRAMVGARDYATMQLNLASRAHRQPGSAFKPATLAAYLDQKYSINDRFSAPAKITVHVPGFPPYTLSNYDHAGHGTLTVEHATWLSVNTVYAQMMAKAEPTNVVLAAHELGIKSPLSAVPSLALGTSEVTPLEMADMYATFAARGMNHTPFLVDHVTDAKGHVIYQHKDDRQQSINQNTADTVNYVLQGVIKNGTGRSAQIGRPAAGKTGTTEDYRDAWFAGYTPELATVVWNGYPGKFKLMKDVRGIHVVGGSFPAQMWRLFMQRALADLPATPFAKPNLTPSSPSPSVTVTLSPTPTPSPTPKHSTAPSPSPTPSATLPTQSPSPKPSKSTGPSPSPSP